VTPPPFNDEGEDPIELSLEPRDTSADRMERFVESFRTELRAGALFEELVANRTTVFVDSTLHLFAPFVHFFSQHFLGDRVSRSDAKSLREWCQLRRHAKCRRFNLEWKRYPRIRHFPIRTPWWFLPARVSCDVFVFPAQHMRRTI
jgi:hypothetical protein